MDNEVTKVNSEITCACLKGGATVDLRTGKHKFTALRLASGRGNLSICKVLLAHGADVNALDNWKDSSLH